MGIMESVDRAAGFLASKATERPLVGMITGTGLGGLTKDMEVDIRIPYSDIPGFSSSTIEGHKGTLACGRIYGKRAVVMEGRLHLYEGYEPGQVVFPVRVMARMGVECLLISSAAGGLNPWFIPGDLMLVRDHINLTGKNPLTGPNPEGLGPRFPDMSSPYDPRLIRLARSQASALGIDLKEGVYAGVSGPSLETPAETRFLRAIGADAVGMSTVLEVIAAVHSGLRVAAVVAVTNVNLPDCMRPTTLEEVITNAERAAPALRAVWRGLLETLTPEGDPTERG
ncbi:MAG: purine-nucleoside phosphorylase [Desulfobacteraceae bacterium]